MAIRFAKLDDVPSLVEGCARMHAITRFRNHPFNARKVEKSFASLITQGQGKYVFLVAAHADGQIVGALIGVMEQQIFSDAYTASVMHIDVLPEARMGGYALRLLRAFEKWAGNRGALEIAFGVNSDADADLVGRFAIRTGYRKVGENFVKS